MTSDRPGQRFSRPRDRIELPEELLAEFRGYCRIAAVSTRELLERIILSAVESGVRR